MENLQAIELRIGNFVEYLGEFKEVLGMDEETVFLKNTVSVNYLELDEISPIPLTEEWLLKLGFNNNIFDFCFEIIDFYITNDESKFMFQSCLEIKTVHQLQNLYFALTNNELIFKS